MALLSAIVNLAMLRHMHAISHINTAVLRLPAHVTPDLLLTRFADRSHHCQPFREFVGADVFHIHIPRP